MPAGADMGLGCGNPQAIAALRLGEVVLDLGSGGGFDCFLAAQQVGASGRVLGVDMTPQMVSKARANAGGVQATNVEFQDYVSSANIEAIKPGARAWRGPSCCQPGTA